MKLVGNQGKVLGVDTSYVEEIEGAEILRGSIEDESIVDEIIEYFERKVNQSFVIFHHKFQVIGQLIMQNKSH